MTSERIQMALAGAVMAGVSVPAIAADVQSELATLKAQIAELKQQQDENWLTERRAEEIKGLVKDVLADAETRASLLAEGATAGISEKGKIFLQSADGSWKINFGGQLQFRYIYNENEGAAGADDEGVDGFQARRTKFKMSGHIADPKIYYGLVFEGDDNSGNASFEDAYFGYKFDGGWYVQAGIFKLPFARQELVSSTRQTAVDRSIVTEHFTLDRAEQVQFGYKADDFTVMVSGSDGADNQFTDPLAGAGDQAHSFGVTGRVDWKVFGDWKQAKDELAWGGEDHALFVGAAAHWENNKNKAAGDGSDTWYAATIDVLYEFDPFSVSAAAFYAEEDDPGAVVDGENFGFYVQGAMNIDDTWAPFVRYEFLEEDEPAGSPDDSLQAVTAGVNYFLRKHSAKVTADVVYLFDGTSIDDEVGDINNGSLGSGLGLTSKTNDEDQFAVRVQFQLLF